MQQLLPAAVPAFAAARVVDFHVQRFPGAVSWFSPGSFASRPPLAVPGTSVACLLSCTSMVTYSAQG